MSILSFKIRKFKSDFPRKKLVRKFLEGKGVSSPQNLTVFFKKMVSKRMSSASSISLIFDFLTSVISWFWICCQKISKAFIMSILSLKVRKFKSDLPRGKWVKKFLKETASPPAPSPHRYLVIFSRKWYQKTMISDSKTWKIPKSPKMTSKGVYEPLIKSYEQIFSLKILKFKSYFSW